MSELYVSIDGDDVGHRFEHLLLINDGKSLASFSADVRSAMAKIQDKLVDEHSATIVFSGGDNLLAKLDAKNISTDILNNFRAEFWKISEITVSIGLGKTPRQAYLALKLAKTTGKNQVRYYEELVDECATG